MALLCNVPLTGVGMNCRGHGLTPRCFIALTNLSSLRQMILALSTRIRRKTRLCLAFLATDWCFHGLARPIPATMIAWS